VVQRDRNLVVYRIAAESGIPDQDRQEIIEKTQVVMGTDCAVTFEEVDLIRPSASGKLRYTIREF
jgi:hypothetical protein